MNVRMILMRTKVVSKDINSYHSECGCRRKVCFKPRYNGRRIVLEESGHIDIQDHINSFAPYTDLHYMLSRLKVGDMSVLSSRAPSFGNFTAFPSDPAAFLNLVSDVERRFAELPEDVRTANNNDWRTYFVSLFNNNATPSSDGSSPDSTAEV